MTSWTFLSHHAQVFLCIARDPDVRLRDIAAGVGHHRASGAGDRERPRRGGLRRSDEGRAAKPLRDPPRGTASPPAPGRPRRRHAAEARAVGAPGARAAAVSYHETRDTHPGLQLVTRSGGRSSSAANNGTLAAGFPRRPPRQPRMRTPRRLRQASEHDRSHARFRHGRRRHPPRRHARCACALPSRTTSPRSSRSSRALSRAEPLPALPRPRPGRRPLRPHVRRARLGRAGRADRRHGRDRRRSAIVAVGELRAPPRPRSTAEAAFAVADDFQRSGIGTRLLEQLAAARRRRTASSAFVAEVLPENQAMLAVFENIGFRATRDARRRRRRGQVPDRAHRALPGARRRARPRRGHRVAAAVLRARSRRRRRRLAPRAARSAASCSATSSRAASPVPPTRSTAPASRVAGVRAYRSIEEIPDPIDLA